MALEAIAEVGHGGSLLRLTAHDGALRDSLLLPLVSDWRNFESWTEAGSVDATERAHRSGAGCSSSTSTPTSIRRSTSSSPTSSPAASSSSLLADGGLQPAVQSVSPQSALLPIDEQALLVLRHRLDGDRRLAGGEPAQRRNARERCHVDRLSQPVAPDDPDRPLVHRPPQARRTWRTAWRPVRCR